MRIFLISLGCDKNLCDSEVMLGALADEGHIIVDDEAKADVIIVNSCCFIGDAQEESIEAIIEAGTYKEKGNCRYLIVAGCLSQRFKDEFFDELPEVDATVGITEIDRICELINSLDGAKDKITLTSDIDEGKKPVIRGNLPRLLSTGGHYAYMKIAEGCNKRCTYCIIPSVRGDYRSVPMDDLVKEATKLAEGGVTELILVAQETTVYGIDLYGKKSLTELLRRLAKIEGLRWIRILYCYPEEITDELIETIKHEDKIVNYLDIPIQSAADSVLKNMGRLTSRAEIEGLIDKLRSNIPDIAIRTTFISGFPGESEEDHEQTIEFIKKARFTRLGVFTYSREDGTKAAKMDCQIDEDVKARRKDEIMLLQKDISSANMEALVGKTLTAFIEGRIADDDVYVGRTYMDAPDVDGYFFINCPYELNSGDYVRATVTGSSEYDLIGEILDESSK